MLSVILLHESAIQLLIFGSILTQFFHFGSQIESFLYVFLEHQLVAWRECSVGVEFGENSSIIFIQKLIVIVAVFRGDRLQLSSKYLSDLSVQIHLNIGV